MDNPRYPHKLKIFRAKTADDLPVTDAEGNPEYDMVLSSVFGYRSRSGGRGSSGGPAKFDYKISLPPHQTDIHTNDLLVLKDYTRTYQGSVVDAMTYNWGSNIWFDEVKN